MILHFEWNSIIITCSKSFKPNIKLLFYRISLILFIQLRRRNINMYHQRQKNLIRLVFKTVFTPNFAERKPYTILHTIALK